MADEKKGTTVQYVEMDMIALDDEAAEPRYSKIGKIVWILLMVTIAIVCIVFLCQQISRFSSARTHFDVEILKRESYVWPPFLICGTKSVEKAHSDVESIFEKITKDSNPKFSDFNLTLETYWEKSLAFEIDTVHLMQGRIVDVKQKRLFDLKTSVFPVSTIIGECRLVNVSKSVEGSDNALKFWLDIFISEKISDTSVNLDTARLIVAPMFDEFDPFFSILDNHYRIMPAGDYDVLVEEEQTEYLNTREKPCKELREVRECEYDCYVSKTKNPVTCKLPFMSRSNLPMCDTLKDTRDTLDAILDVVSEIQTQTHCNCPRKCVEYRYNLGFEKLYTMPVNETLLAFTYDSNTYEVLRETYDYPTASFVCDMFALFAFFMAFCALTPFKLVDFYKNSVSPIWKKTP